jgi:hypothetical protein
MKKKGNKQNNFCCMALATAGGLIGGLGIVSVAWRTSLHCKKRKIREMNAIDEENHQALKEDLPDFLAKIGEFTEAEVDRYRALLDRAREMFDEILITHFHTALCFKSLGYHVDMTEEEMRRYFDALQVLCDSDFESKWLEAGPRTQQTAEAGK